MISGATNEPVCGNLGSLTRNRGKGACKSSCFRPSGRWRAPPSCLTDDILGRQRVEPASEWWERHGARDHVYLLVSPLYALKGGRGVLLLEEVRMTTPGPATIKCVELCTSGHYGRRNLRRKVGNSLQLPKESWMADS